MSIKKILLVDDDRVFVNAFSMKLRAEGYQVITAPDGAGAVKAAREAKPDLIVLDIVFPPDVAHGGGVPWDGFLIIDWLRRMAGVTETPIILVSAGDPAAYVDRARKAGASGFFPKAADIGKLVGLIHQFLDERPAVAT
jgi:two-component system KDP operon response regulator KdpE